jgi:uncharacterized membrane protein YbhN (UPF0104 family)
MFPMTEKHRHRLGQLFGLGLFCLALFVLYRALKGYSYQDVVAQMKHIPTSRLLWGLVITAMSYIWLTFYDTLALKHIKVKLAYHRVMLGSYVGYVFSHNATLLGGVAARYRVYSHWGITPMQTAEVVAFCGMTFWLGFFWIGGVLFLIHPFTIPLLSKLPFDSLRPLAVIFLVITAGYVLCAFLRRKPIKIIKWHFAVPSPSYAIAQVLMSAVDWGLAAGVLWAIIDPAAGISYWKVLGVFLMAQTAGMVSHVPGGLSVFEVVALTLLSPPLSAPSVIGTLLIFRVMYFLIPLFVAVVLLGGFELLQRRGELKRLASGFGRWGE